jgi:uncharacterized phage protein gp47/JayE
VPWSTPTLKDTRRLTRDYVLSQLGAKAMIPNSALRIMSDAMAGLGNLAYLYLDWLAKQLMPDTSEKIWLDRHGIIWLTNADGSKGRKAATFAAGAVMFQGIPTVGIPTTVPIGTLLNGINAVQYQTTSEAIIDGSGQGTANMVALTAGVVGNLSDGDGMSLVTTINNITSAACYGDMLGGFDQETDEQLRERVLSRIQNPPMGGSQADYVNWALACSGVTRAWCAPMEMGIGTVTVRFLMDTTYPDNHGLPTPADIATVSAYVNSKRPVTVEDCFVLAPILFFYDVIIRNLDDDTPTVRGAIEASIAAMEYARSKPGQTMYRAWVDEAISQALGENSHELDFVTQIMPAPGYMPTLGTIFYV